MIIAEISIVPIGSGTNLSKFVKTSVKSIEESGLNFIIGPMSTVVEANSIDEIFNVVKKAHEGMIGMGALRVITSIKIDDRRDKKSSIKNKLNSLK